MSGSRRWNLSPSEHEEQATLFQILSLHRHLFLIPDSPGDSYLDMAFAVPNGAFMPIPVARKMVKEGLKKGVLDIWLPVPRGGYHGLVLEMKVGSNQMSQEQEWWAHRLAKEGYMVEEARGWDEAWVIIQDYLRGRGLCSDQGGPDGQ